MKNIAIAVVLLVILGGIWMLGTTEKNSNWSTGQLRKNISRFIENGKRSDSALQQTININMNSSEAGKNMDDPSKGLSGLLEKTAEQVKPQPKDNLRKTADPNNPDPSRSWTTEAKTARPVEYMNQVLAYLKKRRVELRNMRFDVGTTLQEWKLKKKRSSRNVKGCDAVLREAVAAYQKDEADNSWPVDFAYRDYSKKEMMLKLKDYHMNLKKAEEEDKKIAQGLERLQDTSKEQDHKIRQLENEIQIYSDNLELIRSGKINSRIADFMKKLDETVADQKEIYKENLETAEREVFQPAKTRQRAADASLEDILRDYGAKKK